MTNGPDSSGASQKKTALIVEGGAMRGAWAAGVLSSLHERGYSRFDLVYAASSGACSAAYFVAGMLETGLSIWREHVSGRKLVRKTNFLRHKPLIDLAYLVDHVFKEKVPLSIEALQTTPTNFYIVLTDCETGDPVYFHARDEHIFDALKATASLPFATAGYAHVQGKPYADGGLADPLPIRKAIEDGATDITVVQTHGAGFRLKPMPRFITKMAFPQFPAVAEAFALKQHLRYNSALDLMSAPPEGVRVKVFRPLKPLKLSRLTQARCKILEALQIGRQECLEQLPTVETLTLPLRPNR